MARSSRAKQIVEGQDSTHYVSPRKKRGQDKPQMQPPLTPMIDVTFQLLIFFLLTATFRPPERPIPGSVPDLGQRTGAVETAMQYDIVVTPSGTFQEEAVFEIKQTRDILQSAEDLYAWLEGLKNEVGNWGEVRIAIDPALTSRWGHVVNAYNQAVRAGYEKIGFVPQ